MPDDTTTTPTRIRAPWTPEQVDALNRFQSHGGMHPFTCGNEHNGTHVVLIAHPDGWHCSAPPCDYRQDWAHAFMAEPRTTSGEGLRGLLEHVGIDLTGKTITIADGPTIAEMHERNARTTPPAPALRERIAGVFRAVDGKAPAWTKRDAGPEAHVDAVLAVVQPVLDEAQQRAEGAEAHPSIHRWRVEHVDGDEWVPASGLKADRAEAVHLLNVGNRNRPMWADGTPVQRRLVRETTSYTVDTALTPPAPADQTEGEGA